LPFGDNTAEPAPGGQGGGLSFKTAMGSVPMLTPPLIITEDANGPGARHYRRRARRRGGSL